MLTAKEWGIKIALLMPAFDSKFKLANLRTDHSIRDNIWLLSRLDHLWSNYFSDVTQDNPIFIQFGRYSQFRLGSIKFDPRTKKSVITITSMFKDPSIPVEVVDHTIGHELCHYTHGFSSPKEKMHRYPHSGGVIQRELAERNLQHLSLAYKKWVKQYRDQLKKERGWI
jgi:hypothetical protein